MNYEKGGGKVIAQERKGEGGRAQGRRRDEVKGREWSGDWEEGERRGKEWG